MKKTLIVTLEFPPTIGGIATYIHQMAKAMPPESVVVLAPPHPQAKEWDAQQSYTIIRKSPFYSFIWPQWLKWLFAVKKIIKQHKIQIVHVHHALPIGYIAYMLRKKVPYLVFSHGTDIVMGTKSNRKKKLLTRVAMGSQQVVMNSQSLMRRLAERIPELKSHMTVLYPCPEPLFLEQPEQRIIAEEKRKLAIEGRKTILSVGRIAQGKGMPQLALYMSKLLKKDPNLAWVIVGDGPKRQDLMKAIQQYNLHNVVRFIGEIPHEQLQLYYHLADAFVVLTHPENGMEEGLGLVFLEASAAGLPVIAGRSGGVEEAVAHGETGYLVDTFQEMQVISAIERVLYDSEVQEQFSTNGVKRITEFFQWQKQMQAISEWMN